VASTIGIKIANGEFYPVLEENSQGKKRLVLTTVHDKQSSMQIDLYKTSTQTMKDALYIGSLVIESIKPQPKGDPSIELVVSSTQNGEITANAVDLDVSAQKEQQTLNISLQSFNEDSFDADIPDFDLEQDEDRPPAGLLESATVIRKEEKRNFPWLMVVCAALILTAIALAAWLFFFKSTSPQESQNSFSRPEQTSPPVEAAPVQQPVQTPPPEPAATPAPEQPVQAVQPPAPPPVIQAPESPRTESSAPPRRQRPTPPVASYKVPSVIPREGARYRIRYGDTLWDIAEAFYRNPWLYPRIARFNNIRNPDLIISGTTIRVPPRN
jgi:hypothetical protein